MLLNALPAVEFEKGLRTTQELYIRVSHLMKSVAEGRLLANWTIPVAPLFNEKGASEAPFAVLLGLATYNDWMGTPENPLFTDNPEVVEMANSNAEGRCFGTGMRIYLHETDEFERGGLFCSAGQWGVEVILHRYLMKSSCRTTDPADADFFWVPDYRACHWHLTPKPSGGQGLTTPDGSVYSIVIQNHQEKVRDVKNPDDIFRRLLQKLEPWFSRNQGADHIFTFSDQGFIVNFTHTFPSWREHIHSSIFLTTEAFTPG